MIITKLKGGLGNQMFQYIVGLQMATEYKEELKMDITGYSDPRYISADTPRKYRLHAFSLSGTLATDEESNKARNPYGVVSKLLRAFNQRILKRHYIDYEESFFKKKRPYVEGYFQSEKNFIHIKNKVSKEFSLKPEFQTEVFLAEKNKIDKEKSVSVHIRRGDYVTDKKTNDAHGTCSKEYYEKGMEIIKSKIEAPLFYFFSDDIEWVKKEFGYHPAFHYVSNPKLEDYEELMLMTICAHNIIANSSFSWWGAWLNQNKNKIVIAPKKWTNINPSPQPNILPDGWIAI